MAEAKLVKTEVWSEDLKSLIKYISEREQNLARYSNKLREAVLTIADIFTPRKINISFDVVDDEPFYKYKHELYYLAIVNNYLVAGGNVARGDELEWDVPLENLPREAFKSLIKSGRLVPFLNKVAKAIGENEVGCVIKA